MSLAEKLDELNIKKIYCTYTGDFCAANIVEAALIENVFEVPLLQMKVANSSGTLFGKEITAIPYGERWLLINTQDIFSLTTSWSC